MVVFEIKLSKYRKKRNKTTQQTNFKKKRENESPEEWIAVWKNDTKRATKNEKFAIVDSNNVLVLSEGAVTNEQFAAHVARPDVKAHIERTRETGKLWGAFPK
jgi:3-hydroxy-3-methylglutaryl CoA synthase